SSSNRPPTPTQSRRTRGNASFLNPRACEYSVRLPGTVPQTGDTRAVTSLVAGALDSDEMKPLLGPEVVERELDRCLRDPVRDPHDDVALGRVLRFGAVGLRRGDAN